MVRFQKKFLKICKKFTKSCRKVLKFSKKFTEFFSKITKNSRNFPKNSQKVSKGHSLNENTKTGENADMNELLVASIETLPPLPKTVQDLQQYICEAGANAEPSKVAQIISSDPLVTAKLLQLANSPFYGFSSKISTIQQVINLLGVGNIRNIVTADAIRNNTRVNMSPYNLDTARFLSSCNDETRFISSWLMDEDRRLAYMLVPCAMLLRFGMIVFANFFIQIGKDKAFLNALKSNKFENIAMVEEDFLGVDHLSFLGYLFHKWNFDEVLLESVCFVNAPHSARDSVKKNAYALAITNHIFAPYDGGSEFRVSAALALFDELKDQGINFRKGDFAAKLPDFAKRNLPR